MTAFLLAGGIISDRVERRRVLIAADIVRALVAGGHGCAVAGRSARDLAPGRPRRPLRRRRGVLRAGLRRARSRRSWRPSSSSRPTRWSSSCARRAERLLGPALGGVVVAAIGSGERVPRRRGDVRGQRRVHLGPARPLDSPRPAPERLARQRALREGLAFVRSQPWLWATLIAASLSLLFFLGPLEVLLPFVIRNDLDAGAGGYGAVLAAAGAGSVARVADRQPARAAAALSDLRLQRCGRSRRSPSSATRSGPRCGSSWPSRSSSARWRPRAWSSGGRSCPRACPPDLRGRVHSLDWFVSIGLTPLSFALTGPISTGIGVDATLVLAGVLPMIVCVVLYFVARLRRDEDLHPAAGDDDRRLETCSTRALRAPRPPTRGQRDAGDLVGLGLVERLAWSAARWPAPPGADARARCSATVSCSASSTIRRTSSSTSRWVALGRRRLARAAAGRRSARQQPRSGRSPRSCPSARPCRARSASAAGCRTRRRSWSRRR